MVAAPFAFVTAVVDARGLVVTSVGDHACRVEPQTTELPWFCDLDDGTPTGENNPASFVRWVCPALRRRPTASGAAAGPVLEVRRSGPQSDLGRLVQRLGRLAGRAATPPAGGDADGPLVYTDPGGILDLGMRHRIESWPAARHGDGVVRPAELSAIKVTREGLVVESVSWWDSAPALDHQIGLAVDIARRLAG
jgi:hypothetical protein